MRRKTAFVLLFILGLLYTGVANEAAEAIKVKRYIAIENMDASASGEETARSKFIGINKLVHTEQKVTVISIPGLSFQELEPPLLQKLPNFQKLIKQGKLAALNVRTPIKGVEDSYLSIGAGAPAMGSSLRQAFHKTEKMNGAFAADLYRRFQGNLPEDAEIVVPEIAAIHNINANQKYKAQVGLLGDVLQQNEVSVYVFGNRDRGLDKDFEDNIKDNIIKRHAPLMIMNSQGWVPHGEISASTLIAAADRPYSVKTNYAGLLQLWLNTANPSLIVIELGDLDRLDDERQLYSEERFIRIKEQVLREMDQFIEKVSSKMTEEETLWIFSPIANSEAMKEKSMLTPLILYKEGLEEGFLVSSTTRRVGIVSNYDLAPTILHEFGIKAPVPMIGLPLKWDSSKETIQTLQKERKQIEKVYILRPKLIYSFLTYQVAVLLLGLVNVLRNWQTGLRWMIIPLLSVITTPLIMLWMGWIARISLPMMGVFFVVVVLLISWVLNRLPVLTSLGWLGIVTGMFIFIDGIMGSYAMKRSVLGYDPMIGARYYGIGNEFMGVLIGATILGVTVWLQLRAEKNKTKSGGIPASTRFPVSIMVVVSLVFAGIVVYLAAPTLGTNAGGAISATAAFGIAWLRMFFGDELKELRLTRLLLILAGLIVLSLGGLWLLNAALPMASDQQSHIGRAMNVLKEGHFDVIGQIMLRKLEMNWHLIVVSSWSKVLITSLFVIAVMVMRPRGVFRSWQMRYPYLMIGFSANTVGAFMALVFNDSGIVAAATMIIYAAVPMLLLKLDEGEGGKGTILQ